MGNKLITFFNKHKQEIFLFFAIVVYIIYFTAASFLRYSNFYTGRFDLGNMDQTVWNTVHGRFFQLTNPDGTNIISRLAFHADFILVLLAPFYLFWQDPRMLLLIQTIVSAFGAIFMYLIAKQLLKNKNISLIIAVAFLLNPSLEYANLYDFHAVTLATTFFLMAFYFLKSKKYMLYCLSLILAALTKEQVWVVSALFGIYTIFESKKKILGISITVISLILFYIIFFKAIPLEHGGSHFALSYYSDFGSTPKSILTTIVFSPQKTASLLFARDRLVYLFEIFMPVGFLSFVAPLFLIFTGPDMAINLLSNNSQLHQIFYQYTAVILPFIFISAIHGILYIRKVLPKIPLFSFGLYILITTIFSAYFFGPLPFTRDPNTDMFTKPLPYAQSIDAFLTTIPLQYSVAATNNVGSHLSHREKIFTIPVGIDQADVLVFLLNDKFAQPSLAAQKEIVKNLQKDKRYVELFNHGDFIVFKKKQDKLAP
ncbi:MAG TPA: DUF2079 domain-containing protein [Patescibacteria group bacterium]